MTTLAPPNAADIARRYRDAIAALGRAEAELTALAEACGGAVVIDGWRYVVETEEASTYPVEAVDRWAFGLACNGYGPYAQQFKALKCEGAARRLRITREAM